MCLSKKQGSLGLRDTRRWNDALLAKAIWNIHAKKDTLWCQWVHHYYVKNGSIWEIMVRKDFPPLIKHLLSIRDGLLEAEGSITAAINHVSSWVLEGAPNTSLAYDYFKGMVKIRFGPKLSGTKGFPLSFFFFLWLVVLGRLPTMDRLCFLEIDRTCKLCNQQEENFPHLFFACPFHCKYMETHQRVGRT